MVSFKLQATLFQRKELAVPIGQDVGWVPESVLTKRRRTFLFPEPGLRTLGPFIP
jgi:hypothetical protein